jgi:hypothetical protein
LPDIERDWYIKSGRERERDKMRETREGLRERPIKPQNLNVKELK